MDAEGVPLAVYSSEEIAAFAALEEQAAVFLRERTQGFQVPRLRFEPTEDDILVFRLPPKERRTKGGIIMPTFSLDKKADGYSNEVTGNEIVVDVGILLAAGNSARDWMRSHGVFLGDYIRFGHYAGREQSAHIFDVVHEIEGDLKDLLQLKAQDIRGSFDLHWRVNGDEYEDKNTGEKRKTAPVLRRVFVHDGEGNGITIFKPIVRE